MASNQPLMRELGWRSPAAFIVNGIGDYLIALPALRALASLMRGRLRLLCLPAVRDIFFPISHLQPFITFITSSRPVPATIAILRQRNWLRLLGIVICF